MTNVLIIAVIAFFASFLCVSTGGAGLITTPSLIFLGLSPQQAIATDLLSMLGTTLGGFLRFRQRDLINYKLGILLGVLAIVGCWIGSTALLHIEDEVMRKIKGVFLLVLIVLVLKKREAGLKSDQLIPSWRRKVGYVGFILVGVWGSFFGGGFNVLATYIAVSFYGLTFLQSAGTLTLVNLSIGIASCLIYSYNGCIQWPLGLSALLGKYAGAYMGAGFAEQMGNRWVRVIFASTVFLSAYGLLV